MFCMYSSCPPSSFLPLQRPVPLWAAAPPPPIPPPAGGLGRGPTQDSPEGGGGGGEGGHDPPGSRGLHASMSQGSDGDGDHRHSLIYLPSKSADILSAKRRRPGSAGPKFYSAPSSSAHRCSVVGARHPADDDGDAAQDRGTGTCRPPPGTTNSSGTPESGSGNSNNVVEERTVVKTGSLDRGGNSDRLLAPVPSYQRRDENSKDETAAKGPRKPASYDLKSLSWPPTTSPPGGKDDRDSPPMSRPNGAGQWGRLTSPHRRSPPSPCSPPRNGALKFGIDAILMNRDRIKDEASVENVGPRFLHQTQHHHHHLHQTLLPQRTLPPLLRIRPPKSPGLAYPPSAASAVYSPHLFHLQGPPHFPPSSASSSASSSSSSSSLASHMRSHVIPTAPPPHQLHYALHHSFQVPTRLPDFSGNAFALLGSNPDLHSPHLHHHHHHAQSKKKRSWSRAVFSNLQRKGLEKRFEVQKYVTKPDRRQLAAMLGLTDAQVKVWFQNRRMKWRHQEEALKKKDPESKKPSQRPTGPDAPSAPNGPEGANTPREAKTGFDPECAKLSAGRSVHSESEDESSPDDDEDLSAEDHGLLFTGGRIHAAKSGDAAAASLRTGCIMSVADILDLRKNYISGNAGSRTPGTGNDVVDDDDDGGGDVEDDVISVISSAM